MSNLPGLLDRLLLSLVVGLPLLVVMYAVVMGAAELLATLGDPAGALALRWVGTALAILFVAGTMLVVLLLGWERVSRSDIEPEE